MTKTIDWSESTRRVFLDATNLHASLPLSDLTYAAYDNIYKTQINFTLYTQSVCYVILIYHSILTYA